MTWTPTRDDDAIKGFCFGLLRIECCGGCVGKSMVSMYSTYRGECDCSPNLSECEAVHLE